MEKIVWKARLKTICFHQFQYFWKKINKKDEDWELYSRLFLGIFIYKKSSLHHSKSNQICKQLMIG